MATLKEDLNSFLEITGASDVEGARTIITAWKEGAADWSENAGANAQLDEIFAAFGVTDHTAAIERINALRAECTALHSELGATDQASALESIARIRGEHGEFQQKINELTASQADFDGRVNQEVINRAASAGIPEPVKKNVTQTGASENVMPRADFEALPSGEQMKFVKAGGKLTD